MRRFVSRLAVGCTLVLAACEVSGPLDSIGSLKPLISVDSFRTVVSGVVLDGATGDLITSPTELSFAGEAGHLVRDLFGEPVGGWTSGEGFASYGIANSVRPRPDRAVELRVVVRAAGYRTNSTRIEMRRDGRHEFRVLLMPEGLPDATAKASAEFVIRGDSTVSQARVAVTSLGAEVLSIRIPSNSRVSTASGAVDGTQVVEASWRPPSLQTLSQFPGGLDAGVRLRGGLDIPATLTTGAVISIVVPGSSPLIFDDSLDVISLVSPSLRSPLTNAPILPGDKVDILRWMPEEGIWLEHARTEVRRAAGKLTVGFRSAQTGTYSVGFFNGHCRDARVTLSGNTRGGAVVAWHGSPAQADSRRVWRFAPGQGLVVLEGPPGFWQGTLEVRHDEAIASVSYTSLCSAQLDVALEHSTEPDAIEVTATPLACSSFGVTSVSTLSVLAIPRTSPHGAEGALLRPPYVVRRLGTTRASAGRVTGFSFGPIEPDDALHLILGSSHWQYPPSQSGLLDLSDMAREAGFCG